MDKDKKLNSENFEKACNEMISTVLSVCEKELIGGKHKDKALPLAALAVQDSILTFLALVTRK